MVQLSNATAHLAVVDSQEGEPDDVSRARDAAPQQKAERRVGLSPIDRIALEGLVDPRNVTDLIGWTESSATALAGSDRYGARLRLISRAVATERARLLVLEGILDQNLAAGSPGSWLAIREMRAVIADTTRGLCALLREHAAACHVGRHDVVVAVAHVDEINVAPGK